MHNSMRAQTELTNTTVRELSDLIKACRKLRDTMAFAHYAQYGVVPQSNVILEADEVLKRYCVPSALSTIVKYETATVYLEEDN